MPGASNRPPGRAGRDEILKQAILPLSRIKAGRSERSPLLVGLRGVGKTVLLVEVRKRAEAAGYLARSLSSSALLASAVLAHVLI